MQKHFSKALALLLALIMVLSVFPAMSFATEEDEAATLIDGLPADGSYGVIYYCGTTPGAVFGFDVSNGTAPAKTAPLSADGGTIPSLPNGAAVFKFIKNADNTYYLMLGSKYLAITLNASNKSQIVLLDTAEGAKWDIAADGTGAYTVASHDVSSSYKYLEYYQNAISAYKMTEDKTLFQFKFFSCSADEDGRVGEPPVAGSLPVDGGTYVVYNHYAKAVFGQPTGPDAAAPALLAAPATLNAEGTLNYEDISDGGMIFTVHVSGTEANPVFTFENNGKYLAMPENTVDENGKVNNDETLLMIDWPADAEKQGYAQWTLTEITGGYCMYNVSARYKSSKCCVEFFNEVFSGWSYYSSQQELYAMNFYPMEDKDGVGYVVNPTLELKDPDPAIGSNCPVEFEIHDISDPVEVFAQYMVTDQNDTAQTPKQVEPEIVVRKGSFTIPAADLENGKAVAIEIGITDALGKTMHVIKTFPVRDEPLILTAFPAANSATGEEKRPEIGVTFANVGSRTLLERPDNVDPAAKFSDVANNKWYTDAVDYVVEWGYMSGVSDTVFGTNTPLTREMFVTILWKMAGAPRSYIANPFTDVSEGNYSYKAILWAYENGITSGRTPTTFDRKGKVTRQELALFLYKYAMLKGTIDGAQADITGYSDAAKVSAWAQTAIKWAVAKGLISGVSSNGQSYLKPRDSATRAQVAVIVKNFDQLLGPHISEDLGEAAFEILLDGAAVPAVINGTKVSYTPEADLDDGKHTVSVTITRADGKSVTKSWNFFVGEGGETLYFGQVHSHTAEYSDGVGTLEDAYEHAQAVADLDFLFVTDHSNYFDTTSTATTSSYYDLSSLLKNAAGTTTKWEEARATAKEYNERYDDFLCLYGYEMTWSGGPGHTNTFNTYGVISRNNKDLNNKTGYAGMHLYNDLIVNAEKGLDVEGKEAKTTRGGAEVTGVNATKYIPFDDKGNSVPVVSQFNHPGKTFGNFDNYAGYSAKRDDVLNLIEVGNGEGKVGGSAYFPSYSEYDLCLSMGWHVAPTNNQDNHKGNWGDSNTCRDVILTDDFSEIGVYRALDARRVYSTEDQNLRISYELEARGETFKLGSIAPFEEDDQPETVTVKVNAEDPDRADTIATVEIIGEGGKTLKKVEVNANDYTDALTIPNTDGYYYVRIVEADGDIAVTAPVWVKEAVPVAADLETSAAVAAQGEEETVTATLTNGSETESLTLTAYKVEAEDRVLEEKTGLTETVAAGTVKTLTIPFTPSTTDPSAVKTYEIKVTFTVIFKGKELVYTKTITETSYPPEMMTYIGLDKGHDNFYVSGDYAGNEGNFIDICAQRGILCKYIDKGEMTKENLARFKAVLITVPRINETTKPTTWTEDELEALADYAAKGGTILNFSKSDRYDYAELVDEQDTYNYASATLSNAVNEAVGAKTRFLRGIVVDNEKKANEAYRIYFDGRELLGDHLFTEGIYPSSNGRYQWYNGTGITIEEGADVVSLVNPYESTWVASYKANFTGSSYEPDYDNDLVVAEKGTFSLATAEQLSGGGWLVCSGATFISNYDLKYGDPANEQYENYLLVCNILDFIKDGEFDGEVTPIAQVHQGEVGQEFTIEGIVTSNASDYDKDTAFFDCIYIQDETRGINAFPVSGYYFIGEKVRAHGGVTYYCGEIELNLSTDYNGSIKVISNDLAPVEPMTVTCAEAMSDDNIGNLMKITGVITEIHETAGVVDMIYVDDGSGEQAMLFINGYIQKESHALDGIEVGMYIEGVGIGSRDVDEASGGADGQIGDDVDPSLFIKRLRVRSRDELLIWAPELDTTELEAAIAEAQAIDRSLYTEASLAALDEALTAAQAVMANPDKTQRMVTEALSALRTALNGLEEIPHGDNVYVLIQTAPQAGDKVVIVNAANNIALSSQPSTPTSYYNGGVTVAPVNGLLSVDNEEIVWDVGMEESYYTFSYNGQKFSMDTSYSSTPFDKVNYTWTIEPSTKTAGAFYIKNVGRSLWLEWYQQNNYWSCYRDNSNEALFALNFYVKSAD